MDIRILIADLPTSPNKFKTMGQGQRWHNQKEQRKFHRMAEWHPELGSPEMAAAVFALKPPFQLMRIFTVPTLGRRDIDNLEAGMKPWLDAACELLHIEDNDILVTMSVKRYEKGKESTEIIISPIDTGVPVVLEWEQDDTKEEESYARFQHAA